MKINYFILKAHLDQFKRKAAHRIQVFLQILFQKFEYEIELLVAVHNVE
jgi:hypothetical protein